MNSSLKLSKIKAGVIFLMIIIVKIGLFIGSVSAAGDTVVSVLPASQVVAADSDFEINVSCSPGQPVKAFELKMSFDDSLIQVNSVTEGDIFNGFETFFSSGIINNSAGTLVNVYGLIMGVGNVSSNGSLVIINITSLSSSGISGLNLYEVGVTNETAYVPLSVNNGSVQVDASAPLIVDNSPSSGDTGDLFTFNATVTDNVDSPDELTVMVDWSHGSFGNNESMVNVGGNYFETTIVLDSNSISDMTYTIFAQDTLGNSITTSQTYVSVSDNDNPSIDADNSDSSGTTGDAFDFNVTVSDNIGVDSANVSWSHGGLGGNLALNDDGDGTFSGSIILDDSLDNVVYQVQVNDTSSNFVRGSQQSCGVTDNDDPQISNLNAVPSMQNLGEPVNISVDVHDNIAVGNVYLNISYPDSSYHNFSIIGNNSANTYYCNSTYNTLGTYNYYVWTEDSSINSVTSSSQSFTIGEQTAPQISNLIFEASDPLDTNSSFGWVNISCDVTDNIGVSEVCLNITNPDGSFNNVSMIGDGSYYYNTSIAFSNHGNYSYFIWAKDTQDNINVSSTQIFSMPPNWDIDINGVCKVYDLTLLSNHYGETGSLGWIREDVDNNGVIEILDFVNVSNHYNESWWV